MSKVYLNFRQNIKAAIVFLNLFGLYIDEENESEEINIFIKDNIVVGKIIFDYSKVIIKANTEFGVLEASYDKCIANSLEDSENNFEKYAMWNTTVNYIISNGEKELINGEFIIDAYMDETLGNGCSNHSYLQYFLEDETIELQIQNDGVLFGINFKKENINEYTIFMPFDSFNGYIRHVISEGECNPYYPYREWYSITKMSELEPNVLKVLKLIEKNGEDIDKLFKRCDSCQKESKELFLKQLGDLMKSLDPNLYDKIRRVSDLLVKHSFFDNLISVCLARFLNDDIESLIGIEKKPIMYKGNEQNLDTFYFGNKVIEVVKTIKK